MNWCSISCFGLSQHGRWFQAAENIETSYCNLRVPQGIETKALFDYFEPDCNVATLPEGGMVPSANRV
jgi:hypothetical protein